MYVIGITGPSGAGKTTALRVLEALGGQVYDCDAIYHEMLRTDPVLLGQIEAAFPGSVRDYVLDRKALGAKLFADPAGLQRLTDLTQPLVAKRVLEEIAKASASGGRPMTAPTGFAVIDAIGLFESGLAEHCDLTAAVIADPELRVRRLVARDGITEDYARARIAAQKPMEWYAARADLLLENNGDEADFSDRCQRVFGPYLDRAFNSTEGAEGCGETGQ